MPFAPAAFLSAERGSDSAAMFGKYGIAGDYFFYPAQFWAHKNHVRILEALVILREEGWRAKVVFVGGDKGNLGHVENFIRANDLAEQVYCLGYVPSDSMRGLYEGCIAVIMPTYFGPTNLPPLEAWATERPLIYSRHLNGQTGDAAIGVNVDDPGDIASAMRKSLDPVVRATLIEAGTRRLQEIGRERKAAESELSSRLDHFEAIRGCWA